jgi:fructose-bisphosphate aldolase class I
MAAAAKGINVDEQMRDKMGQGAGFLAALDQSGGSTPKALSLYGVTPEQYSGDEEMFDQIHAMRVRIMTDASFTGARIVAAILFEQTMDRDVLGRSTPDYLWNVKGVVPLVKVDKGLAPQANGAQIMKPMPDLPELLARAKAKGVFGTKMRSVIQELNDEGIAAVVEQQFEVGQQINDAGLVPILEPEVDIHAADKAEIEVRLLDRLLAGLESVPQGQQVMLKLTLPTVPNFYAPLIDHPKVLRVVALSGGYSRDEACHLLAENHNMIASFSRALTEGLSAEMTDAEYSSALGAAIEQIYLASIT